MGTGHRRIEHHRLAGSSWPQKKTGESVVPRAAAEASAQRTVERITADHHMGLLPEVRCEEIRGRHIGVRQQTCHTPNVSHYVPHFLTKCLMSDSDLLCGRAAVF